MNAREMTSEEKLNKDINRSISILIELREDAFKRVTYNNINSQAIKRARLEINKVLKRNEAY